MEQIRVIVGIEKPSSTSDDLEASCPTLSRQQRLIGFVICFGIGYFISFASTFALMTGSGSGPKFGILYSLGNIIALCASGFLVGPCQQVKLMMKPVRRVAAFIYLGMIVVVLVVAIAFPELGPLVLLLVFVQFMAAVWYSASYVPFGRKILKTIAEKLCGCSSLE